MSKVLKDLKTGPGGRFSPDIRQLVASAEKHPKQFAAILSKLFYSMVDEQFRQPNIDVISRYTHFSREWPGKLVDDASRFYLASLEAYANASAGGFRNLTWKTEVEAEAVAASIKSGMPELDSVEGLAWRCLLGQVQSIYSRDEAAATFNAARTHKKSSLVADFTRNVGVFSYFSEEKVAQDARDLPTMKAMQSWASGNNAKSEQAILISVDPHFFRIYGPMILINAQQLPNIDFIILMNAPAIEAQKLHMEAYEYLQALSTLNKQAVPRNLRFIAVEPPSWVANEKTFYSCSRIMVLPELLQQYMNIYAIDADLFMIRNPEPFLQKNAKTTFGVTRTEGLHGVPPWRRYMAGNIVVNSEAIGSPIFSRIFDYLSVGLREPISWTLDQNALCFGVEGVSKEYLPVTSTRPTSVGNFLGRWERNYKKLLQRRKL